MYELLDFGDCRRLERFGRFVLDRPAAGTESIPRSPAMLDAWSHASARFELAADKSPQRGRWHPPDALPNAWTLEFAGLRFELRPTEFGHVGLFPEQADNWRWLQAWCEEFGQNQGARPRVLNLFAYTGASTLAAAAAGAEVVHIDSARGAVAWARKNAELSGLNAKPIRWIVEDARRFVERELARDNRFDAVILDPPSYGHGPKGQAWKLARDLPKLLAGIFALLASSQSAILLTSHTAGFSRLDARQMLEAAAKSAGQPGSVTSGELNLTAASGKTFRAGIVAKFIRR